MRFDDRLPFTLSELDDSVELTAGCFAPDRAEEFRVPIKPPIREALSERAAGCSALLGTDGLVVFILLPKREVRFELILLLVFLVERFVITLLELPRPKLLLLELLTLDLPLLDLLTLDVPLLELFLLVTTLLERLLLDDLAGLIEVTIRDVMLGLILLLVLLVERFVVVFRELTLVRLFVLLEEIELLLDGVLVVIGLPIREVRLELILPFELLRLLILLLLERFEIEEFDRVVICRPSVLEFGAVVREFIDRLVIALLDVFLFVARLVIILLEPEVFLLVMALLEKLLLGVRLVIDLLEMFLLGVRLVILLFDMLLLGALLTDDRLEELLVEILLLGTLLIVDRLEPLRDEARLERLDVLTLGAALGAGAGRETLRLELLDLLELRLDRDDLAANTGSQNNKSAKNTQKTRKSEPFCVLTSDF